MRVKTAAHHKRARSHCDFSRGGVNSVVEHDGFAGAGARLAVTVNAVLGHVEQVAACK